MEMKITARVGSNWKHDDFSDSWTIRLSKEDSKRLRSHQEVTLVIPDPPTQPAVPNGARWKRRDGLYYRIVGCIVECWGETYGWQPSFGALRGDFPCGIMAECALDEHARREGWEWVGQ